MNVCNYIIISKKNEKQAYEMWDYKSEKKYVQMYIRGIHSDTGGRGHDETVEVPAWLQEFMAKV